VVAAIADPPLVSLLATMTGTRFGVIRKIYRVALPSRCAREHARHRHADDVLDIAESEATEDIQKLGGSEALEAPYMQVGLWSMIRKRAVGYRRSS